MDRQNSSNSSFGGSSVAASTRRRQADFIKLATSGKFKVTASENVGDFFVLFEGPPETPYEGGYWNVHVVLTEQYPYKSPSIGFGNRIFHPNVEERSGAVCLDVINQTWTPMYDLVNVFDVFLPQLMRYPNSTDPMNPAAAQMQLQSMTTYTQYIHQHISQHATLQKALAVVAHLNPEGEGEEGSQGQAGEEGDAMPPPVVVPSATAGGGGGCSPGSNVTATPESDRGGLTATPPSLIGSMGGTPQLNPTPPPKPQQASVTTAEEDDDDMPEEIDI